MSADLLILLPVLVPLSVATLCAIAWGAPRMQAGLTLIGALVLFAAAIALLLGVADGTILTTRFGDWSAPFGIAFAADRLAGAMVAVTGLIGVAVGVYAIADVRRLAAVSGFYPLYNGLLAGVCGAFLTADLFNLYVWFEVMLISSFGLLVLNKTREQLDGGVKYLALNMLGTMLFLTAIALIYGVAGTLNLADIAITLRETPQSAAAMAAGWLLLLAFLMKSGAFPVFAWLPASYHTGSIAVVAIFAGLLTKVGVYAVVRTFTLVLPLEGTLHQDVLLVVAGLTMVVGVFGAAVQWDVRRILSFHIISQIGYMLLGLALFTPYAIAAAVFYIVHHIVVKANLFLLAGVIGRKSGDYDIRRTGGLMKLSPVLAILFLVPALSLVGIPPLSGFWAKLMIVDAGIDVDAWILIATALFVGLMTLYSMGKIWTHSFWRAPVEGRVERPAGWLRLMPIAALAAVTVAIGVYPEPLVAFALGAGEQLHDPSDYIAALLPPADDTVAEVVE